MFQYVNKELRSLSHDEGGQSVVFVTLILMTLAAFIGVTINVGNFVATKIRMQNLVDASALNGAIWEARGFNVIMVLNAAVFSAEWVWWTEFFEMLYRLMEALDCGFWWWCIPLWVIFVLELIDCFEEYDNLEQDVESINDVQEGIAKDSTFYSIAAVKIYEDLINEYRESDFPGTMFLSGSVMFDDTPWGGGVLDLLKPSLACEGGGNSLLFNGYFQTTSDYPQDQWIFTFAYRNKDEEPFLSQQFDAGGEGFFTVAQARPYSKASSDFLNYKNIYSEKMWDVKLMPINFDNMLWSLIDFPPLEWLLGELSNAVILH